MFEITEYIAGPMRGFDNYNFNTFQAAKMLRESMGRNVISPHDIDLREGTMRATSTPVFDCVTHLPSWHFDDVEWIDAEDAGTTAAFQRAMRADIRVLTECDAIYMLPGWENSEGANIEHQVALWLGLEITYAPGAYTPIQEFVDA